MGVGKTVEKELQTVRRAWAKARKQTNNME